MLCIYLSVTLVYLVGWVVYLFKAFVSHTLVVVLVVVVVLGQKLAQCLQITILNAQFRTDVDKCIYIVRYIDR